MEILLYKKLVVGVFTWILFKLITWSTYFKFLLTALGNMLPQGKVILSAQGFLDKVLTLFDSPLGNVQTSAVQCLVQYVSTSSPL